jgi:hypothetical protein
MAMTSRTGPLSASESKTNAPTAVQKNLVIVGATGMVGGYALRYALDHPAVGRATTIGRRKVGISHPKLNEVSIKTSLTARHSRRCSRISKQRSSAWVRIPGRYRTQSSAR